MQIRLLLIILFYFFGPGCSEYENVDNNSDRDKVILKDTSIRKWKLDSIKVYRFDEEQEWIPKSINVLHYNSDSEMFGSANFSNYNPTQKLYNKITINRNFSDSDNFAEFNPNFNDSIMKLWNKEEGTAFVTGEFKNTLHANTYRFNSSGNNWFLYSSRKDSLDKNSNVIKRKSFTDSDPGNYPIQNSVEESTYKGNLLIEKKSYKLVNEEKIYIKKTTYDYQDELLTNKNEYFFNETRKEWDLRYNQTIDYNNEITTSKNTEYQKGKISSGFKNVVEKNKEGKILKEIDYDWDLQENKFKVRLVESLRYQDNKLVEKISQNELNAPNYSSIVYSYDYKGRLQSSKRTIKESADIRVLDEEIFTYVGSDTLINSYTKLNFKGEIKEKSEIACDSIGNPIHRRFLKFNSKRIYSTEHDYNISCKEVVDAIEMKLCESNLNGSKWEHINAPRIKTSYLVKDNKEIPYQKEVYFYSRLRN